jgi:hypothetical protein
MDSVVALVIVLFAVTSPALGAETPAEIKHLLRYIDESGCIFIRNGKEYPSTEARSHMEMKYDYAKRKIKTADQFIGYVGTKSSLSGRTYTVRCEGRELPSAQWLYDELRRYRENRQDVSAH